MIKFLKKGGYNMELHHLTDEVDGKIVSSLWLYTVRLPSRYLAVIEEVETDINFRRQGRATQLIKIAIQMCREKGIDCIELTVREDKPDIQAFYQSMGFFDRLNRAYRLKLGE